MFSPLSPTLLAFLPVLHSTNDQFANYVSQNWFPGSKVSDLNNLLALYPSNPAAAYADIPVQREGRKGDIANAAVYLFSDAASFVTGTVAVVDGGQDHVRATVLPYPRSVLDPEWAKGLFKAKM